MVDQPQLPKVVTLVHLVHLQRELDHKIDQNLGRTHWFSVTIDVLENNKGSWLNEVHAIGSITLQQIEMEILDLKMENW